MMENDEKLSEVLIKILEQETSPEMTKIKQLILRRIAMESDVRESRIPAPQNITEIGGYFNLLQEMKREELKNQAAIQSTVSGKMLQEFMASVLGLPTQGSEAIWEELNKS